MADGIATHKEGEASTIDLSLQGQVMCFGIIMEIDGAVN